MDRNLLHLYYLYISEESSFEHVAVSPSRHLFPLTRAVGEQTQGNNKLRVLSLPIHGFNLSDDMRKIAKIFNLISSVLFTKMTVEEFKVAALQQRN